MKSFWANEWDLFMKDLDTFADFLTQPVTLGKKNDALNPSFEEVAEKAEDVNASGFWKTQWNLYKDDCKGFADFLTQPVEITWRNKTIL